MFFECQVVEIEEKLQRLNQRVTNTSETLPALVHDEIQKQLQDLSNRFSFVVRFHEDMYKEKLQRVRDAATQIISDQIAVMESQYEEKMSNALQKLQEEFESYKSDMEASRIRHRTEVDSRDVKIARLQAKINEVISCGIDLDSDVPLSVQMSKMSLQGKRSSSLSSERRRNLSRWNRQNGEAEDALRQGAAVRTPSGSESSTRVMGLQRERSGLDAVEEAKEEKVVVGKQELEEAKEEKVVVGKQEQVVLPPAVLQHPVEIEKPAKIGSVRGEDDLFELEESGSDDDRGRELERVQDEVWIDKSSHLLQSIVGSRCDWRKKVYDESLKSQLQTWQRPAAVVVTWHPKLADGPAGTRSSEEMAEAIGSLLGEGGKRGGGGGGGGGKGGGGKGGGEAGRGGKVRDMLIVWMTGKDLVTCGGDGEDDPCADGKLLDAVVVLFLLSDAYAKDRRCLRHFRLLVEIESLVVIPVVIAKDVNEENSLMKENTELGILLKGMKIEDVTGKDSWGARSQSLIKRIRRHLNVEEEKQVKQNAETDKYALYFSFCHRNSLSAVESGKARF
eukprot:748574-Hanusia_phi.AAC.1